MINARNPAKIWFRQNGHVIFPFLAFAIPLLVRAIPEILMGPYLVGFDTIAYYVPGTFEWLKTGINFWIFIADAPLLYLFTIGVASAGGSIVILIKIMAPILLGVLGLTVYFYSRKVLSWSSKKSLLAVLISTLYFVALRISWDMLRSELGLIFLFLALIFIHKNNYSFKNGVLLSLALVFVVFSNQLVSVIMFMIVMATIISLYLRNKRVEAKKIVLCATPASFLFLVIIYVNLFVYSIPAVGLSEIYSAGFNALLGASYFDLVINTLGFLAFCYLPLVFFLIFGVRKFKSNIHLKTWIFWLFIPILLVIVSPTPFFVGGVLPYRWILLLIYPLAFYAVEGIAQVKWNWYKVSVGFILITLSLGFLAQPNYAALDYFNNFPSYVPKTMLQNTLQLSDCQDTSNALLWVKENLPTDAYLLTHEAFYGWATLTIDIDRLIFYGFADLNLVAQQYSNSSVSIYLIWWVNGKGWYGQQQIPDFFQEVYHSGNIAIYKYSHNG